MLLMSYQTTNFLPGCRAFFSLWKFAIKLACRTGVFFRVFSGEQKEARRDPCTRSSPTSPEKRKTNSACYAGHNCVRAFQESAIFIID